MSSSADLRNSIDSKSSSGTGISSIQTTKFSNSTELILSIDHKSALKQQQQQQFSAIDPQLGPVSNKNCCLTRVKNIFRKKTLLRRLPILAWLPKYNRTDAVGDLIAGITVGLTMVPQGLAYSSVAGLPAQYGLYGAFMGCFAYVLFGTCKDTTVGSTAVASLLIFQTAGGVWQRAVLLTFLTGCIEILMSVFGLHFLVDFVSAPVNAGYTSAVGLIIFTSQMKNLIGVQSSGSSFLEIWISIVKNRRTIQIADTLLGLICIVCLLLLRYIGKLQVGSDNVEKRSGCQRVFNKFLWFLGVSRNALIVIVCTVLAWYLEKVGFKWFHLTGYVPPGVPSFKFPPLSIPSVAGNGTAGLVSAQEGESFFDMVHYMGSGLIVVPLIALLENTSVCRAFAKGKSIDVRQELVAIGIGNIANSFVQGYRANGGLARSAVNNASGVRTPLANLYIGGVVVFSLIYISEYFSYIPKPTLASVIITAVVFTLQYQVVVPIWKSKRADLIPGFAAFIACLALPLQYGILFAIGVNLMFILYQSARPDIAIEISENSQRIKFMKITPDRCLVFPSVEFVRSAILKSGVKTLLPVVIDCTYIYGADYTAAKAIASILRDFYERQQKIIFYNLRPNLVKIFVGVDNVNLVLCYNPVELDELLSV